MTWSEEDEEYVGLCIEYPGLSWLAPTPQGTPDGIRKVVADVVGDMVANEAPVPEPIALRRYSGKFTVRIPPNLHRRLALEAAESSISLNRLASAKLSH